MIEVMTSVPSMTFCIINRPGSVITDFTIQATIANPNLVSVNKDLASSLRSQGFNVSDTAFSQSGRSFLTIIYNFSSINVAYVYNYVELFKKKT